MIVYLQARIIDAWCFIILQCFCFIIQEMSNKRKKKYKELKKRIEREKELSIVAQKMERKKQLTVSTLNKLFATY